MELVIFLLFAVLALAGSLGVVLSRNPVHCALSLVLALVSVAVFFLQQDAQLLAAVQVIVYAGAVVVLFLFVIMLLGVDREETLVEPIRYQRPAALALGGAVLAEVLFLAGRTWATGASSVRGSLDDRVDGENLNNIQRVARTLFTDFLWPFEITAALLVIAVVGGVVLARRSGQPVEVLPDETDEAAATGASEGSSPSERATAGGVSPPAASERE
jgi:NADH-quinone oxidoreductase subunit J